MPASHTGSGCRNRTGVAARSLTAASRFLITLTASFGTRRLAGGTGLASEHDHDAEAVLFEGPRSVLLALRKLLLQGALRVAILAVTTAAVIGFLSLVAASSKESTPALAKVKVPSRGCIPSQCRAKAETVLRNDKR